MRQNLTSREVRPVTGMIDPRCMYSTDGAMTAAGLGYVSLIDGQEAGVLNPVNDNVRDWYSGEELIAWIKVKGKRKQRKSSLKAMSAPEQRSEQAMETKQFSLRTVLTVTTSRLLTKGNGPRDNGIGDLYSILGWMTSDEPYTHQLPRFAQECRPWLLRWFPELAAANDVLAILDSLIESNGGEEGIELWLSKLSSLGLKESYDVPKIPADDHVRKNMFDELVEMRGTDEGIEIVEVPAE